MKVANIGRILGAFGLLLLLSSPFTLLLTSGSPLVAGVKVVAGLVMVGAYLATHLEQFGQLATRRSSFFFATTALTVALVLVALVAINFIAHKKNKRWDLTAQKLFTLSPQTVGMLRELPEKVRAIGFIPRRHPEYEGLREILERYRAEAPERFEYAFKDPMRNPELAAKYQVREGQTTVVLVRGEGAGETHTSLHLISEQELTSALVKLTQVGEQKLYFVVGHDEWPLAPGTPLPGQRPVSMSRMAEQLAQEGYTTRELNLAGGTPVPRDAVALVIAAPKAPFTPREVESLRTYLAAGGRLLYFAEVYGEPGEHLEKLLAEYGLRVEPGVVADAQFHADSPYVVLSLFYGDHEVARPLHLHQLNVEFPTARSLSRVEEELASGVRVEDIVLSSPYGWVESTPDEHPEPSPGEKSGQLVLAAASTRDTSGAQGRRHDEARLVVVGDSELLLDTRWGHEGNRNLVMNALGWVSDQARKITIRPAREDSTLQMDADMLSRIRFVSTDLLPLTLLGVGLAIWLSRRNQ
jgi:hypothetical protein